MSRVSGSLSSVSRALFVRPRRVGAPCNVVNGLSRAQGAAAGITIDALEKMTSFAPARTSGFRRAGPAVSGQKNDNDNKDDDDDEDDEDDDDDDHDDAELSVRHCYFAPSNPPCLVTHRERLFSRGPRPPLIVDSSRFETISIPFSVHISRFHDGRWTIIIIISSSMDEERPRCTV